MIDFDCPACGEWMSVPGCFAGQTHECPECGKDAPVPPEHPTAALAGIDNPFRGAIVQDPWRPAAVDVPQIHADAFRLCRDALDQVRRQRQSASVLLYGEAGSGKTHLMGRLRRRLGDEAVFVSVQLQTSGGMIWRHIRRRVADDVLRPGDGGESPFLRAVAGRLGGSDHDPEPVTLEIGFDLRRVLECLLGGRHVDIAHAYLRGDSLPDEALTRLGLAAEAEIADTDAAPNGEDLAREIVLGLCRLAGPDMPLVFCFDQVEALQRHPGDLDGLFRFGKVVRALHDGAENTLLVSCIQSSFLDTLRDSIDDADHDRLVSAGRNALTALDYDQAAVLAAARMDSQSDLADLRRGRDRLWPLPGEKLRGHFDAETGRRIVARKVIAHCRGLFADARRASAEAHAAEPPAPARDSREDVGQFLQRLWERLWKKAIQENTSEDTDQIIQHALPLLVGAARPQWGQPRPGTGDVDMVFTLPNHARVDISLCNHRSMNSLAGRFRRLLKSKFNRLVLVRDVRLPIGERAVRTRRCLAELKDRRAVLVRPSVAVLGALDAMRKVLSDAKSGALAVAGDAVEPAVVERWLAAHLPPPLGDLLDVIVSAESEDLPPDGLLELLEKKRVIRLDEAARETRQDVDYIECWVREHSAQAGILNGPVPMIYQAVPDCFRDEEEPTRRAARP